MIASKVTRANRRHISRKDYANIRPILGSENIQFPKITSLQGRALRRLLPVGVTLSHRTFDFHSRSYRLAALIDRLRDKGWPVVNNDAATLTQDPVRRVAIFTNYELFADFQPELSERIKAFCAAVDTLESKALCEVA